MRWGGGFWAGKFLAVRSVCGNPPPPDDNAWQDLINHPLGQERNCRGREAVRRLRRSPEQMGAGGGASGLDVLPLLAAPRCPRAALAGSSKGTSVGLVSGSPRGPGAGEGAGLGCAAALACLVHSGVRRQLHVLRERGVREAWRVPLPPRLLRCQLRHQ